MTPQRFARIVTNVVTRCPWLWRVFRGRVARTFDTLAPEWQEGRVTPAHLAPLVAALDRVEVTPTTILDLGTGTGAGARLLASRWPSAKVTGVDLSPEMIREARERAGAVQYEVADASKLPFSDGSFELVTLLNMIPFYAELGRVTAPGGSVILAFSRGAKTPIWVPFDRLRSELGRRGFTRFTEVDGGAGKALLAAR